jgi:photosystem II stability/assembly factor-like uncharacterized protein
MESNSASATVSQECRNKSRLYVGTIGEGLWRNTDGGGTFVRSCDGMFVECHVRALVVHPGDARILYMGTEEGLFVSRDAADSWERVASPLDGLRIWSLLMLLTNPDVMLAGTCPPRLFRTENGGRSWHEADVTMQQQCPRIMHNRVTTLVADRQEPNTVWMGVEIDGIFRSRDTGRTWQPIGTGLSSRDIHALAIVPEGNGPKRILAATNNDLNRSLDNGATWEPLHIQQSLPWSYCRALGQACNNPEVVLLGNGDGPPGSVGVVGLSLDGGDTWRVANMPGRANSTIWSFAVNAADASLIYAASVSGEVYSSTDAGSSWSKLAREFGEIRALAWTR